MNKLIWSFLALLVCPAFALAQGNVVKSGGEAALKTLTQKTITSGAAKSAAEAAQLGFRPGVAGKKLFTSNMQVQLESGVSAAVQAAALQRQSALLSEVVQGLENLTSSVETYWKNLQHCAQWHFETENLFLTPVEAAEAKNALRASSMQVRVRADEFRQLVRVARAQPELKQYILPIESLNLEAFMSHSPTELVMLFIDPSNSSLYRGLEDWAMRNKPFPFSTSTIATVLGEADKDVVSRAFGLLGNSPRVMLLETLGWDRQTVELFLDSSARPFMDGYFAPQSKTWTEFLDVSTQNHQRFNVIYNERLIPNMRLRSAELQSRANAAE